MNVKKGGGEQDEKKKESDLLDGGNFKQNERRNVRVNRRYKVTESIRE